MSEHIPETGGRERFATVLFYAAVLLLAWLVFRIFEPFLVPLAWATVLVVVFHPMHARLEKRFRPVPAAALSTIVLTLILIVPTLLLMSAFINEGVAAARNIQRAFAEGEVTWLNQAWDWVRQRIPAAANADPVALGRQAAESVALFLAARSGTVLGNVLVFFFDLFVMLFAAFFLFRDRHKLLADIHRLLPFDAAHRDAMIAQAGELIQASVTCSLTVAATQGFLGGALFAILGIPEAIFWGVTMAFCALIPLLGPGIVIAPAALWLFLTGHTAKGIVMLAIGIGVVGMVDNLLRPILVSGRAQMSALLIFISVLGGIGVFGMLGLVMGPIVVATAASVLNVYARRELPPRAPPKPSVEKEEKAVAGENPAPEPVRQDKGPVLE